MKKLNSRNWIVSVATAENDPVIFGPFTESISEELAARFNKRIDYDGAYIEAVAYPIQNYGITALLAEFGQ